MSEEVKNNNEEVKEKKTEVVEQAKEKDRPVAAILSLLCSIGVGICWFYRDFEFRGVISGPEGLGSQQQSWLVMDINVFLRRMMLVLAIVGLLFGLKALGKRFKLLDIVAFLVSLVVCLCVGYIVYRMGGKGFWF
jgi:hypothetical protein